jgi:hypothetical protein
MQGKVRFPGLGTVFEKEEMGVVHECYSGKSCMRMDHRGSAVVVDENCVHQPAVVPGVEQVDDGWC